MKNREIKFRAWQDNEMLTSPTSSNYGLNRFFGMLYEDAPVMQYTGLKDKNGKEIYEGDILECVLAFMDESKLNRIETGVVKWEDGRFKTAFDYEGNFKYTNVIGNVYENPELL